MVDAEYRPLYGTYYSNPVIAVINGQRLLITGGADGGLHALKVRTGEVVWSYTVRKGVINGSPIVERQSRLLHPRRREPRRRRRSAASSASMARQVDPKTKKPKLVWDTFRRKYKANRNQILSERFGLASAALADGLLYCPTTRANSSASGPKTANCSGDTATRRRSAARRSSPTASSTSST